MERFNACRWEDGRLHGPIAVAVQPHIPKVPYRYALKRFIRLPHGPPEPQLKKNLCNLRNLWFTSFLLLKSYV